MDSLNWRGNKINPLKGLGVVNLIIVNSTHEVKLLYVF